MTLSIKKRILIAALCTVLLGIWHSSALGMVLKISGQAMTLKADNIPLRSILKQISAMGIIVKIDPHINPMVTAAFTDKNIQDAFAHILGGNSHALVWRKRIQADPELSQIVIYRQNHMDAAQQLPTAAANLDIETNAETGTIFVKNRILIQFSHPVDSRRIHTILNRFKAEIRLFHKTLSIYEITLPDGSSMADILAELRKVPGVGTVEPDYAYQAPAPVRYETDHQIPQNTTIDHSVNSSPVAILDSGLDTNFLNQDLNVASLDALAPGEIISDDLGHGTQMALIASGQMDPMGIGTVDFINPVISIRAFDENGYTSNKILINSIDFAIEKGAKVLSLSWGSETDSAFLEQAMAYAGSKGLMIVAAAGNSPTGKPVYPAAYETVIAVAALAPDGSAWEKSNYGDFVDISAPGFATLPVGYKGAPGTYAGTSIATAYVAGTLAAFLQENGNTELRPSILPR